MRPDQREDPDKPRMVAGETISDRHFLAGAGEPVTVTGNQADAAGQDVVGAAPGKAGVNRDEKG